MDFVRRVVRAVKKFVGGGDSTSVDYEPVTAAETVVYEDGSVEENGY